MKVSFPTFGFRCFSNLPAIFCCVGLATAPCIRAEEVTDSRVELESHLLVIPGTRNFRDLGGIPAADGRYVKKGAIFRSDNLAELTPEGQSKLKALGIRTIVDFRTDRERALEPNNLGQSLQNAYRPWPLHNDDVPANTWERLVETLKTPDLSVVLVESNQKFIRNSTDELAEWFQLLLGDESTPMVFHCSGGKDRSGVATALFLSALGVPREVIFDEYLMTNEILEADVNESLRKIEMYTLGFIDKERIRPIFVADRKYLGAAFKVIDAEYGGIGNYLQLGLGLDDKDIEALQSKFLVRNQPRL